MKSLAIYLGPAVIVQTALLFVLLHGSVLKVLRNSSTLLVSTAFCLMMLRALSYREDLIVVVILIASFILSHGYARRKSTIAQKSHPMMLTMVNQGPRLPSYFILIDESGKRFRLHDSQIASLERQIAVLLVLRGYPKASFNSPVPKARGSCLPTLHLPKMQLLGERHPQ